MIRRGAVVRTSYGSGPYVVLSVHGPCNCPEYLRHINGVDAPSEPHYHLTCRSEDGARAWLNGYRLDGTSVWSDDRIEVLRLNPTQLDLFEGADA